MDEYIHNIVYNCQYQQYKYKQFGINKYMHKQ